MSSTPNLSRHNCFAWAESLAPGFPVCVKVNHQSSPYENQAAPILGAGLATAQDLPLGASNRSSSRPHSHRPLHRSCHVFLKTCAEPTAMVDVFVSVTANPH